MLTALDIYGKTFAKGFRGYDTGEVDKFLADVVKDFEIVYEENAAMKAEKENVAAEVAQHQQNSDILKNDLESVQTTANELRAAVQKGNDEKKTLQQEMETIKAKLAQYQQQAEVMKNDLTASQNALKEAKAAIQQESEKNSALQAELINTQNLLVEKEKELEEQVSVHLTAAQQAKTTAEDSLLGLTKAHDKTKEDLVFSRNREESLRKDVVNASAAVEQAKGEVKRMYAELAGMKEENDKLKAKMEHYQQLENSMKNTLITAQSAANDLRDSANVDHQMLLRDAEMSSKELIRHAEMQVQKLLAETERLVKAKHHDIENKINTAEAKLDQIKTDGQLSRAKLRSLLETQLRLMSEDFSDDHRSSLGR